ncbi:MAG: ComF family protein [Ruminococcaceae bacterium]|nr:ComF family protein [Oscillospiraceae bacterium]
MNKIIDILTDIIYPKRCVFCGDVYDEHTICDECLKKMPRTYCHPILPMVAKKGNKLYLKCIVSPLYYGDIVRSAILALKFYKRYAAAEPLAVMMSDAVLGNYHYSDVDMIIPVPLSRFRKNKRTYNQSEMLATELSKLIGVPVNAEILFKIKNTKAQSTIKKKSKRMKNIKNVYKVKNSELIKDKNILLVDDVVTTGATLNECAKVLVEAGAAKVVAVAAAQSCR